jgi:hypothetical protein
MARTSAVPHDRPVPTPPPAPEYARGSTGCVAAFLIVVLVFVVWLVGMLLLATGVIGDWG